MTRRRFAQMSAATLTLPAVASNRSASAADDSDIIVIPDAQTDLPTDKVTFNWLDSGDAKAFFWRDFFAKYEEKHPNIKMEYQGLPWNEIQTVLPLGIRNGNAPDVFNLPPNIPSAQAVIEGWVAPLDDIIPDFENVKKNFPEGSFVPGITDFDGKTYAFPLTSPRLNGSLLLYNQAYVDEAGIDMANDPITWDGFRDAAKKLTDNGKGQYYGLIFEGNQVGRFSNWVNSFARASGFSFGILPGDAPFDWRTGEFVFTSDEHLAAIDLLLALRDDGSIFPGSLSLNAPEARSRVPQGSAAMIIQGPWNIAQWHEENPDFQFGVAETPVASQGIRGLYHVAPGGDNQTWVYAKSELKAVAGDILAYMGTVEGQVAWSKIVGIGDFSAFPEAQAALGDDPQTSKAIKIFRETVFQGPDPRVGNADSALVYQNIVPIEPNFGTIVQGIFANQIDDPKQAMQELQDLWNTELDRAITAVSDSGKSVSRDDFVFANWDPTRDYLADDYAAR